jgi:hypothetical protein
MSAPIAILSAPDGTTEVFGIDGTVYRADAGGNVTVPASMVPALLAAGFLISSVDPGSITNAMIAADAAIAYAKLALAGAVKLADLATAAYATAATPSTLVERDASGNVAAVNVLATTAVKVATIQVVGAQGLAVADATAGAIVDAEARTALNDLLARVRAHGLIAT